MKFVLGILLLAGMAGSVQGAPAASRDERTDSPERVFQAARERVDARWYPSLVIAYVDGDKSGVVSFGKLADGAKPNGDTVYEIGSITKTFTAALLAEAIRSGRVQLDTPVSTLLPGFEIPSRDGAQITLGSLATQSSGLPYMPDNFKPADPANPYVDYGAAELKAFLAGYSMKRAPGDAYEYSNLGFGLLGFALTQPKPYGEVLRTKIFQPLGMNMTAVGLTDAMKGHLAKGHDRRNNEAENWQFDVLAGCGSIDSTGNDMLRYLKANMNSGRTKLGPIFQLAQQPIRDMDKTQRIGMAWMTRTAQPQNVIWHNGTTFGYASFIGFTADRKHGVAILTNVAQSVDDLGFAALSDAPIPSYKTVAVDPVTLSNYAGVYATPDGSLIKVFLRDGQLYAQAKGEGGIPLFPQSSEEFFTRIDGFHLIFGHSGTGGANLILRQNGTDRVASRLTGDEAKAALSKF